jgi:hypothetical protein
VDAGSRDPDLLHEHGNSGRLGHLLMRRERARRQLAPLVKLAFRMTPDQLCADQGRVDEMLDHVDELIAAGVLNGEQLNCADLQIATSLALIEYRLDVRENLYRRSARELMERALPEGSA